MNKFHCIPHCFDVFIIIYNCPINRTSHKYCKHRENINKDVAHWVTSCGRRYYAEPCEILTSAISSLSLKIFLSIIIFY